jgi:hypothetical protein
MVGCRQTEESKTLGEDKAKMISSPNGIEKLPGDGSRHGGSGAHGGSDGVNAIRGGGAGAEADSRERMGGGHAGRAEHGESQREERGGGAYGEDRRVHGVGETGRREESGGDDAEKKDSRDFGDAVVKLPPANSRSLVVQKADSLGMTA